MPNSQTKSHVHEFVRYKDKKQNLYRWKCNDPDCYFILDKDRVSGKRSLCTKCKVGTLILDSINLQYAFPKCDECSNTKEAKERKRTRLLLETVLAESLGQDMNRILGKEQNVDYTEPPEIEFGEAQGSFEDIYDGPSEG